MNVGDLVWICAYGTYRPVLCDPVTGKDVVSFETFDAAELGEPVIVLGFPDLPGIHSKKKEHWVAVVSRHGIRAVHHLCLSKNRVAP